jgi:hypothetical protein
MQCVVTYFCYSGLVLSKWAGSAYAEIPATYSTVKVLTVIYFSEYSSDLVNLKCFFLTNSIMLSAIIWKAEDITVQFSYE